MQKLSLDVEMKDVSSISTATDRTYGTFTDDDVRSPRTPTYVPTSLNFSGVIAFDPSRIFASPDTSISHVTITTPLPPEPAKPLAWIWQCHLCKIRYPLSVTRRCLHDGHFYCSGETDRPNLKRKKRGQSCSSEFDYIGWKEWGEWRRKVLGNLENGRKANYSAKGCQKCEFPSQCRYASNHTSSETTDKAVKENELALVSPEAESPDHTSLPLEKKIKPLSQEHVTFDSILASATAEQNEQLNQTKPEVIDGEKITDFTQTKTSSVNGNSEVTDRIVKPADKRCSSKKSSLSPIAEELFSKGDVSEGSFADMALQSWNGIVQSGIGLWKDDEDRMELT
jgi:hypothetical protein